MVQKANNLQQHISAVKKGKKTFENAFQSLSRIILDNDIEKGVVNCSYILCTNSLIHFPATTR
jgi:serine protein kinase